MIRDAVLKDNRIHIDGNFYSIDQRNALVVISALDGTLKIIFENPNYVE